MIRPEARIVKGLAVASQRPELLEWLEDMYARELGDLPYAANNLTVKQGRCQMLKEVIDFIKQAPALAAKT